MGFLKSAAQMGMFGLVGSMLSKPKPPAAPAPPPQAPNLAAALSARSQMKAPPLLGGTYLGNQSSSSPSTSGGKSLLGQ